MSRSTIALLVVCLCLVPVARPAGATRVTAEDARKVAEAWVQLIAANENGWHGCGEARVDVVRQLKRGGRLVGYVCSVKPGGYVVVPLYKELAPVKAYSTTDTLNPDSDAGMADLVKGAMETSTRNLERMFGEANMARPEGPGKALAVDYRPAWRRLEDASTEPSGRSKLSVNYVGGQALLSSEWHQRGPHNEWCPAGPTCAHTLVGCVATAAAQIMRYWSWPPFGAGSPYGDSYDWLNMLDKYEGTPTQQQIDAVAELSYEAAISVGMSFGCDASTASTSDMAGAFNNHFRIYASKIDRDDYTADEWFSWLQSQFDYNMPVEYRLIVPGPDGGGHAIVGDGWKSIGSPPSRYIHFNYGWQDESSNAWYEIDDPELGELDEQYALVYVYPHQSLGLWISGNYPRDVAFPYRYFNQDSLGPSGSAATFDAGQFIQFLPAVRVAASTGAASSVKFSGAAGNATRLFGRGNTTAGVRIDSGAVKLTDGGGLALLPVSYPRYVRAYDMSVPTQYQVYVGWERGIGSPDGFVVERGVNAPSNWTQVATPGPTANGWWDMSVQHSNRYFYRIRATKGTGGSEWSRVVSVWVSIQ